jgi:signal peptidase I
VRGPIDRVTERLPERYRSIADWVLTIAIAVGTVLLVKAYVINPYRIPSASMEPTLHCARDSGQPGCEAGSSDRVLANRFIYHFRDPHRGDVVVFDTPPEAEVQCTIGGTYVKRIVGLPGETISQVNRVVFVNGEELEEPYLEPGRAGGPDFEPTVVPEDQYFMMGDNRRASCDSRQWGTVPRDNLIGPVFMIYWPIKRIDFR